MDKLKLLQAQGTEAKDPRRRMSTNTMRRQQTRDDVSFVVSLVAASTMRRRVATHMRKACFVRTRPAGVIARAA